MDKLTKFLIFYLYCCSLLNIITSIIYKNDCDFSPISYSFWNFANGIYIIFLLSLGLFIYKNKLKDKLETECIFAFGCFILYFISVLWSGDAIYLLYVQTCNLNNLYLASTGIALVNSLVGFGLLVLYSLGAISSGV
jgi:hypothetical protein